MPPYVVDASVAVKWYFDEAHSAQAARVLADDRCDLVAPDFIRIEVAAVAWKRVVRKEIEAQKAESIVSEFLNVPLHLESAADLVSAALRVALQTQRTVYDAIYLALAVQSGHPLLTADRRLFDAVKAGPLAQHIAWIGDLA
jgi:predicted nucleic acid-binding protein